MPSYISGIDHTVRRSLQFDLCRRPHHSYQGKRKEFGDPKCPTRNANSSNVVPRAAILLPTRVERLILPNCARAFPLHPSGLRAWMLPPRQCHPSSRLLLPGRPRPRLLVRVLRGDAPSLGESWLESVLTVLGPLPVSDRHAGIGHASH